VCRRVLAHMRSNLTLAECFAILKVPETASFEEIKAAHLRIIKELHPDQYADKPSLRQVAEEELKRVNAAFDFVKRHFSQTSQRDRARTSGTDTASDDSSRGGSGSYTGGTRWRSTDSPGDQSSSFDEPHRRVSRIRALVRVGKKVAWPFMGFLILAGGTWFGMHVFRRFFAAPDKIITRKDYVPVKIEERFVPPPSADRSEHTPPRDETGSQQKTALDPLSPERRAEIFETTLVYAYPPSKSELQFGVDEYKWSPERRRRVAILTSHEPDPFTVKVLETQGEDSKIEFVIRNQTLSGWVRSRQIATIVP
jgi:hypothetical protein